MMMNMPHGKTIHEAVHIDVCNVFHNKVCKATKNLMLYILR